MKIEDLNKTQIVLLTLLVSFVTSIATGVITVSLMEQAPQSVAQTISRVVERTVERVVPSTDNKSSVVTKETTVVVKEEDLLTKSIEKMSQNMVAVRYRFINSQGLAENSFLGWGIVLSAEGTIATDSGLIADEGSYTSLSEDGMSFNLKVVSQDESKGLAILSVVREKGNEKSEKYNFTPAVLGNSNSLRLGQTAIAFGGKGRKSVSVGVIAGLVESTDAGKGAATSTSSGRSVILVEANIAPVGNISGGPLINSFGEVIGMSTQGGLGERIIGYAPVQFLKEELSAQ